MSLLQLAADNASQFIDLSGLPGRQTRTMRPGERAAVGYRNRGSLCEFLGISHDGKEVVWESTRQGKDAGFDLEELYAHFRDVCHGYEFTAYRYNGRWCLGTSADTMQIKRVSNEEADDLIRSGQIVDVPMHFRPRRKMGA